MQVTPNALNELRQILDTVDNPSAGIRIFVQQGCCGPALQMSSVEKASPNDKVISYDFVNFFVDPLAEEMLTGVTIDCSPKGFRLEGMKKTGSCCG